MANKIQIKRSSITADPGTLLDTGELAYSYNSGKLFIGSSAGPGNNPICLLGGDTGDINWIGITAGDGLTGTKITSSGNHEQTLDLYVNSSKGITIDGNGKLSIESVRTFNGSTGAVTFSSANVALQSLSDVNDSGQDHDRVLAFNDGTAVHDYKKVSSLLGNYVSSFNGSTGALTGVSSVNGATGAVTGVVLTSGDQSIADDKTFTGVSEFTGPFTISSAADIIFESNTSLNVEGAASFETNIGLENNDYISNPSAYTIRMMPEGTSATDYGLEFEFSDWGYGPVITSRKASDLSNAGNIKFDSSVVINQDKDLTFGSNAHSRMRWTMTGNNTLQIGVKSSDDNDSCSGALALIHSSHLGQAYRSPGVTHDNPNLYVYSLDTGANDYIRFEHDGTDANIVTGAGAISLQPASGVVGISGDIKFSGDYSILNSSGTSIFKAEPSGNVSLGDSESAGNDTAILIKDTHSQITLDAGTEIELNSPIVEIDAKLRHRNDTNTFFNFSAADTVDIEAGGWKFLAGASASGVGTINLGGVTFGTDGGATFGGDIILAEDSVIQIGGDTEKIVFDGGAGNLGLNAGIVYLGKDDASAVFFSHKGDTDTYLAYADNQITLSAGGTTYLNITSAGTNFADTDVVRPNLKDYSETVNAIGTITGNTAVSFADGNVQTVTGNGDCEFTFTNPPASGKAGTVTLIITNGGANTTTWHSSVKWPGDNAPALTSSGVDVISLMTIDAGTTIYGFVGGINFS